MKKILTLAALMLLPVVANAADDPTGIAYTNISMYTSSVTGYLQTIGIKLFFSLTLLQLVITGYGLVASGEIEASIAKYAKAFIWIAFCLWLMTNDHAAQFIGGTIQYFLNHAISWAAPGTAATFDVNSILQVGINSLGKINAAIRAIGEAAGNAPTTGVANFLSKWSGNVLDAVISVIIIGVAAITVLVTCGYVALKVFMVKIEGALVLAILPLSLAFLGLNAMRDQGFAPFKSMLSLIYRIVILGMVIAGMAAVGNAVQNYVSTAQNPDIYAVFTASVFGFVLMAFLAHKSDQIASTLASGTSNLGSGDAVGAGIAAAAGAGMVGAAGAAGNASAQRAPQSMGQFMSMLTGGGASITSASTRGAGTTPDPAPTKAAASLSSTSSSSSGAPKREGNAQAENTAGIASNQAGNSESTPGNTTTSQQQAGGNAAQTHQATSSRENTSSPTEPSGAVQSANASIGGAPQRDVSSELGRLVDSMNAPKRKTAMDHASALGNQAAQEKATTGVSVNTHHD